MNWHLSAIGCEDRDAWSAALDAVPHSWWHSWEAANALSHQSARRVQLIFAISDRRERAVCVVCERSWKDEIDICTPWGFTGFSSTGPAEGLPQAWSVFAASKGYVCGYFALHPALRAEGHFALARSHELYMVDLLAGSAAVLERSHHSVGRTLRDWERQQRGFITDTGRIRDFLLSHYRDFMLAKRARPAAIWSQAAIRALCEAESVLLAGTEDAAGLCAVHVVGWTKDVGDSLAIVSVRDGRRDTVALTWWAIQRLAERGVPVFNLGGGVRPGDSVASFKREKFAPRCVPMWSAYEIYRPEAYERLAGELPSPDDARGFFPPWHASLSCATQEISS
jgi:hypothetical protein